MAPVTSEATWNAIQDRLKQAQLKVKDVHTVIVTHSHPDHFGGSDQLAEEAGADVLTHESFRSLVAEANDDFDADLDSVVGFLGLGIRF